MSKITTLLSPVAAVALCATFSFNASAASIITQTPQGGYAPNSLGASNWSSFTSALTSQHTVTQAPDFSNLAQMQTYSAAWVNQELYSSLNSTEISNLQSYIGSGHKAVFIGENYLWNSWNSSIMNVVGGSFSGDCSWGSGTALVANSLTAGVGSVGNVCGSTINNSGSIQMLFSNSMAALYTVGTGAALVILDSNWNDNYYGTTANNQVFAQNVINWLGEPVTAVPEPETYAMLLAGLGLLGFTARRRKDHAA